MESKINSINISSTVELHYKVLIKKEIFDLIRICSVISTDERLSGVLSKMVISKDREDKTRENFTLIKSNENFELRKGKNLIEILKHEDVKINSI